jgi:hypothetical protein
MDTWLLLHNVEFNGERNRTLYVLKSRGMAHSNQVREFGLSDAGIDLVDAYLGNAFGVEPLLVQSAFFRPHNRSEDIGGLYLVGAGTQPGAGTPSVMMSAKMTARLVAEDFAVPDEVVSGKASPELSYR